MPCSLVTPNVLNAPYMKIPFIKYSKFLLIVSGALTVIALLAIAKWGLKYGIDFTGGSLMELSFSNRPTVEQVQETLKTVVAGDSVVQRSGESDIIIRTTFLTEEQHQKVLKAFSDAYATGGNTLVEKRLETIGSSVSETLRKRAVSAIIAVNVAIILYIAYAFRKVSRPIASWKYGALAIVALVHDILIVVGVFAALGHFIGLEIETDFVLALLTVLGFSVTDTIVVYDRIRENVLLRTASTFSETVDLALNETLMRSINTTITVLLPLFALYFLGGESIKAFALALLVGMASGTYSSIFIASPLLVYVERWQERRAAKQA